MKNIQSFSTNARLEIPESQEECTRFQSVTHVSFSDVACNWLDSLPVFYQMTLVFPLQLFSAITEHKQVT